MAPSTPFHKTSPLILSYNLLFFLHNHTHVLQNFSYTIILKLSHAHCTHFLYHSPSKFPSLSIYLLQCLPIIYIFSPPIHFHTLFTILFTLIHFTWPPYHFSIRSFFTSSTLLKTPIFALRLYSSVSFLSSTFLSAISDKISVSELAHFF